MLVNRFMRTHIGGDEILFLNVNQVVSARYFHYTQRNAESGETGLEPKEPYLLVGYAVGDGTQLVTEKFEGDLALAVAQGLTADSRRVAVRHEDDPEKPAPPRPEPPEPGPGR